MQPTVDIVIVDDDLGILKVLSKLISRFHPDSPLKTVVFSSGEDALEYLENSSAKLLITDIQMDGMSGFELCEKVIEHYRKVGRIPPKIIGQTSSRLAFYESLREKSGMEKLYDKNRENFGYLRDEIAATLSAELAS